jgi:hypothetical protein
MNRIRRKNFGKFSMDEKDRAILEHISDTIDKMYCIMKTPRGTIKTVLEYLTAVVSIMGIIAIIDVVIKWIFGG